MADEHHASCVPVGSQRLRHVGPVGARAQSVVDDRLVRRSDPINQQLGSLEGLGSGELRTTSGRRLRRRHAAAAAPSSAAPASVNSRASSSGSDGLPWPALPTQEIQDHGAGLGDVEALATVALIQDCSSRNPGSMNGWPDPPTYTRRVSPAVVNSIATRSFLRRRAALTTSWRRSPSTATVKSVSIVPRTIDLAVGPAGILAGVGVSAGPPQAIADLAEKYRPRACPPSQSPTSRSGRSARRSESEDPPERTVRRPRHPEFRNRCPAHPRRSEWNRLARPAPLTSRRASHAATLTLRSGRVDDVITQLHQPSRRERTGFNDLRAEYQIVSFGGRLELQRPGLVAPLRPNV